MKVLHLQTGKPTDFSLWRERLLATEFANQTLEIIEAELPRDLNPLLELIRVHDLTRDDVIVIEGPFTQKDVLEYLKQRGMFAHLPRPQLRRVLTDAGRNFWKLGTPRSSLIWD